MAEEYIKREPILKFIEDGLNNPDKSKAFGHDAIEIMTEVQYAPAADVVEVVRCKDCKYWNDYEDESYCSCPDGLDNYARPNDFCSYGERRDNE